MSVTAGLPAFHRARQRVRRWIEAPTQGEAIVTLEDALPGTDVGAWLVEERFPLDHVHGAIPLASFFKAPFEHLKTLVGDPRLKDFDPNDAVFLDIETTGLDHGAGTIPFMIGLAFRDGDAVVLQQIIVRNWGEEAAALRAFREVLDRFRFMVSFNGKSFDLTVLQGRLVMHRLYSEDEVQLKVRPHLDLLHLARSVYKGCWENTKLQTVERERLGLVRVDDIPGHLVPACWFAYVRHGRAAPVVEVARHNRDDMLSMVTMAACLMEETTALGALRSSDQVSYNLARLLFRRGAIAEAVDVLDGCPAPEGSTLGALWWRLRADCARRHRDHRGRHAALERLVAITPADHGAWAELGLICERLRDWEGMQEAASRALTLGDHGPSRRRLLRSRRQLERALRG